MAENKVELLIQARDEASKQLTQITAELNKMGAGATGASHSMDSMGNATGGALSRILDFTVGMTAANLATAALQKTWDLTVGSFQKGIASIDQLAMAQASLAAAARSNAPGESFSKMYDSAGKIVEKVYELDRAFIGTGDELLTLADSMVTFGMGIDLTTEKAQKQFVAFANMLKMVTRDQAFQRQAFQEVRALMEGQDVPGAMIVKKLEAAGVKVKEMIPLWQAQGTLLENIMLHMKGYDEASGKIEMSLGAQKSSLETITYKILRQGTAKAYEDIRDLVKYINDSLMDQNGLTEKGRVLVDILQLGWDAVKTAAVGTYNAFAWIVEKMERMATNWQKIVEASNNYVAPIEGAIGTVSGEDLNAQEQSQGKSTVAGKIADLLKAGKRAGFGDGELKLPGGTPQISDAALKAAEHVQKMVEDLADRISVERARERGGETEAAYEKARIDWINRNRAINAAAEAAGKARDQEAVNMALRLSDEQYGDDKNKATQKWIDADLKLTMKWIVDRGKKLDKAALEDAKRQEKTFELMDKYNEGIRQAQERAPRPWDTPGAKERSREMHDFINEQNNLAALKRKGEENLPGGIDATRYGELMDKLQELHRERMEQIEDTTSQATARVAQLWVDMAQTMDGVFSSVFMDAFHGKLRTLGDYFNAIAEGMAASWSRALGTMLTDWIQTQARMAAQDGGLIGTLGKWIGGALGMGGSEAGPEELGQFAKGGVFGGPRLFRFAQGVGMLGEAGPEGVLPLRRNASGDLGVIVAGGGKGAPQAVSVQIINETGQAAKVRESNGQFNGQELVITAWMDGYQRDLFGMRSAMAQGR